MNDNVYYPKRALVATNGKTVVEHMNEASKLFDIDTLYEQYFDAEEQLAEALLAFATTLKERNTKRRNKKPLSESYDAFHAADFRCIIAHEKYSKARMAIGDAIKYKSPKELDDAYQAYYESDMQYYRARLDRYHERTHLNEVANRPKED